MTETRTRMIEAALRGCANDADEAVVTPGFTGPHPMVWGMAWQARGGRTARRAAAVDPRR